MIAGLLLAAGSGRRFGKPKALVDTGAGPWVLRALATLAGTDRRTVVVGAAADEVAALLPPDVSVVRNPRHEGGMGSSLQVGLGALAADPAIDAALVMLVDLPDVPVTAAERVLSVAEGPADGSRLAASRSVLARASYRGVPGHPVLIGRDHFAGVMAAAVGDRGARDYLAGADVTLVECGDLAGGVDVDELPPGDGSPGARVPRFG